ncbi:MAG: hypothetical protein IKF77_01130, partial [Thermoguttaceae bacterium]|nr:hypothetical protein [Thermoguttaceae bacterium]
RGKESYRVHSRRQNWFLCDDGIRGMILHENGGLFNWKAFRSHPGGEENAEQPKILIPVFWGTGKGARDGRIFSSPKREIFRGFPGKFLRESGRKNIFTEIFRLFFCPISR